MLDFDDIPEGKGGTIHFNPEKLALLGTTGCYTVRKLMARG
jgi:hypothetical protein